MFDNKGNSFALTRLMTTKYPLCMLVMELAVALEERGLALDAEWSPREWNSEADVITNANVDGFAESRRVPFDLRSHPWRVLGGLLVDGRRFYADAQAARSAARLKPATAGRTQRRRRASLKETDPW